MKKQNKPPMTKKEYVTYTAIGIVALVMFFGMLVAAAILQDNGVDSKIYTPIGLSSFLFAIVGIIILLADFSRAAEYEMRVKGEKIDKSEFTVIENVSEGKLRSVLSNAGFKEKDGYLHKRQFSFAKDYVNYFIRMPYGDDIICDPESEARKADDCIDLRIQNKCLILIDSAYGVTPEMLNSAKDFNKIFILVESVMPSARTNSAIYALLDTSNNKLYILEGNKHSISVYSHGIKLLKKLLK